MRRFILGIGPGFIGAVAALGLADSNQHMPSTQPATQPLLAGEILTGHQGPATLPSRKPTILTPTFGAGDGGGNRETGVLLNGGIGATIATPAPGPSAGTLQGSGGADGTPAATTRPAGK